MSPQECLRRACARITDPVRWTQHEQARDVTGARVEPHAASAVCWSADGALNADDLVPDRQAARALYLAAWERGARCISELNDAPERTHAEVLALYERAVAIALEQPEFAIGREHLWAEYGLFCTPRSRVRIVAQCPDPTLSSADGPVVEKLADLGRLHRTRANDLFHIDGRHVLTSLPRPPNEELERAIVQLGAERGSLRRPASRAVLRGTRS